MCWPVASTAIESSACPPAGPSSSPPSPLGGKILVRRGRLSWAVALVWPTRACAKAWAKRPIGDIFSERRVGDLVRGAPNPSQLNRSIEAKSKSQTVGRGFKALNFIRAGGRHCRGGPQLKLAVCFHKVSYW